MSAALKVSGLTVRFGGVHALDGVDLEIEEGQLLGLIGPNGAGKTTFIDAVTGFVPYRGRVELVGRDLAKMRASARARLGLGRTWQSVELFEDLTVRENLAVVADRPSARQVVMECLGRRVEYSAAVDEALEVVGLTEHADAMPDEISLGHRKLIGVARALAARPHVLCLDEPAAGLDSHESLQLGTRLRTLADAGNTMLLIDHDMDLVLSICDRLVVLDFGKVIAYGAPDEVRRDPRVVTAYLGGGHEPESSPPPPGSDR